MTVVKRDLDCNIDEPYFTVAELARVSGFERAAVDVQIRRKVIVPTRRDRVAVRGHSLFSAKDCFRARLIKLHGEHFGMGPSDSARLADVVVDDDNWMWAAARRVDAGREPLDLRYALSRIDDRWKIDQYLGKGGIKREPDFGPEVPFVVLPVGSIFTSVYRSCREMKLLDESEMKDK
jgi:hypothetical protein